MHRLEVKELRCVGLVNPIGIDRKALRLTWTLHSAHRGICQMAFQVIISENEQIFSDLQNVTVDSGRVMGGDSVYYPDRLFLDSRKRYYWSVRVWDDAGVASEWSDVAFFETGLLYHKDWTAKWIEPEQEDVTAEAYDQKDALMKIGGSFFESLETLHQRHLVTGNRAIREIGLRPCPILRKKFCVNKEVNKARIYATAHGIYRLFLNGRRIGDLEFAPEATPYKKYLQYQTYDITEYLEPGENVIGVELADGWWAGRLGTHGTSAQYGSRLAVLLQLEIGYTDGSKDTIGSDGSFCSSFGARRYADLRIGEKYDARKEQTGWQKKGFYDGRWQKVREIEEGYDNLVAQRAEPMRVLRTFKAKEVYLSPKGQTIVDFGQLINGRARFTLRGKKGTEIHCRYFEQTDQEGNFYHNIMGRNCHQEEIFVFDEEKEWMFESAYSMRGFRYVWIEGAIGNVEVDRQEARLIASDIEYVGDFSCSVPLVNKLFENIRWSIISNMTSIPTDNPDRERAGWTGDAMLIAPTACSLFGMEAFFYRWIEEIKVEQESDGQIPMIIPYWKGYAADPSSMAGWGDVCVHLPWVCYLRYGDKTVLETSYDMMRRWEAYLNVLCKSAECDNIISEQQHNNFGDWLKASYVWNAKTDKFTYFTDSLRWMMPTYFYINLAKAMKSIAEVLDRKNDADYYEKLHTDLVKAARRNFYDTGKIYKEQDQGAIVLALQSGIIPEDDRNQAICRLLELIEKNNGCMDTGFISTAYILDELVKSGKEKQAYDLLLKEEYPSWLYEVKEGATAVWEAWCGVKPDHTPLPVSFLQYGNAVVGDWIMRRVGGLDASRSGKRRFTISPVLDSRIREVCTQYKSVCGMVIVNTVVKDETVKLVVEIPANATAEIMLKNADDVKESGIEIGISKDVFDVHREKKGICFSVGSGRYEFEYHVFSDSEKMEEKEC